MKYGVFRVRKALIYIFLSVWKLPLSAGIIQNIIFCELPTMNKIIYMFGEAHTDPFDKEAMAQRQNVMQSMEVILDTHRGSMSWYLECNGNIQEWVRQLSWFDTWDLCRRAAYFEQWYVPLSHAYGADVEYGRLNLANFDIRDDEYAQFKCALIDLVNGKITCDDIDFVAMRYWANTVVSSTIKKLLEDIKKVYPKKLVSYVNRDIGRKKGKFYRMLNAYTQESTYCAACALNHFYNFTDLLPDLTILKKLSNDPCNTIVIHAGSAHIQNISHYFTRMQLPESFKGNIAG